MPGRRPVFQNEIGTPNNGLRLARGRPAFSAALALLIAVIAEEVRDSGRPFPGIFEWKQVAGGLDNRQLHSRTPGATVCHTDSSGNGLAAGGGGSLAAGENYAQLLEFGRVVARGYRRNAGR